MGGGLYIRSATFGGMCIKNKAAQVRTKSYGNSKGIFGSVKLSSALGDLGLWYLHLLKILSKLPDQTMPRMKILMTNTSVGVENCEDLNKSQNTSSNDNNVESIRRQPTYAEIARRAVK